MKKPRIPPVQLLSAQTVAIIRQLERGRTNQAIVDLLGLTYPTVNNVAQRWKAKFYAGKLPELPNGPPSPAMVRLAQFDPIVRRAMEQKRSEEPQPSAPVT